MYAQVSVGLKKIMAAFQKLLQKFPQYETELAQATELLKQVRQIIQCRLTMIPLYACHGIPLTCRWHCVP
jgi:hypothetical protein